MTISPEIRAEIPGISHVPESLTVTESMTESGIEAVPSQPSQTPVPDPTQSGVAPVAVVPSDMATPAPTFTVPADQTVFQTYTKGNISDSKTWFGYYWIRMIKKALHLGWRVVIGQQNNV